MAMKPFPNHEPRFVTSADGTKIYADAVGEQSPRTPTIVLLHGFSVVAEAFSPIFEDIEWISNAFLVRYDLRGHGKSGKPVEDEAWKSERISEDFQAVCKEFNITKTFVLGWSLGSVQFVDIFNHTKTVAIQGFINVAGAPFLESNSIVKVGNPGALSIIGGLVQPMSVDHFQECALAFVQKFSEKISPNLARTLLEGVIMQPRTVTAKLLSRTQDASEMIQAGRDGKLNYLLVIAGKDGLMDKGRLETLFVELNWKNQVTKVIPEADHMPWVSVPIIFREAVMGWVKEQI